MTNDQRSIDGQAPCGVGTIIRGSGAVEGYRGRRVEIRALRFSEQRNAALNEQRTTGNESFYGIGSIGQ